MTRPPVLAALLACCLVPGLGAAQGLPAYAPINPVAASRTGLSFEPYRPASPGRWTGAVTLDYASAIEHALLPQESYDLDAEIVRLRVRAGRDLGPATFIELDASVGGAYDGFLDGFLNWYHRQLGITLEERERRPNDAFLYRIALPDGVVLRRRPSAISLGDMRAAFGFRPTPFLQTVASLTLPTSTAPAGYGRGVPAAGLLTTVRLPLARPLVSEASLGLGYTPTHGDLAPFQRTGFASASAGARWRFWGRQSVYANLLYHSPYYRDTGIPSLDRRDLSLDFGWILATRGGREWRVGMTEDMEPGGPAVDLVFRLGVSSRPTPPPLRR